MTVGEHHGVGGDDPAVEGLVADEPEVQVDPGDLRLERLQFPFVVSGSRIVDPHRADDVQRGASGRQAPHGGGGPVEALVRLDEADAHEDVLVVCQTEGLTSARAIERRLTGEVGAVLDHPDLRRGHTEALHHELGEGGVVDGHLVGGLEHGPGGTRRRLEHGGGRPPGASRCLDLVRRRCPTPVDLVEADLDRGTEPEGGSEGEPRADARGGRGRVDVEDVGVEVDDDPVEALHEATEGPGSGGADQIEVMMRRRRLRGAHLDVVARSAEHPHLLQGVGADAVPVRRVRRDHEDALSGRGHDMVSRLASMRSRVTGQV